MALNFDDFIESLDNDLDVGLEILASTLVELDRYQESFLKTQGLADSQAQKKEYIFLLHKLDGLAQSIFAEILAKCVEDLQVALEGGTVLDREMISSLNANINNLRVAIGAFRLEKRR